MSDEQSPTCTYKHQIADELEPSPAVSLPQTAPERCSHRAAAGENTRCLFHSEDREFPPSAISEAFTEALESTESTPNFAGGKLGSLNLAGEVLETTDGSPIDLRGAVITGDLVLTDATISAPLLLGGATIEGELRAENAHFEDGVDLSHATVGQGAHLYNAKFEGGIAANDVSMSYVDARAIYVVGSAVFDDAYFKVNVRFARSTFKDGISFDGATWGLLADFAAVEVDGIASYKNIEVGGELRFANAHFTNRFDISESSVSGTAAFQHLKVAGDFVASDITFGDEVDFDDIQCTGEQVDMRNCLFEGYTSYSLSRLDVAEFLLCETTFEDEAWFVHGNFSGSLDASDARFCGEAHFRDAKFEGPVSIVNSQFDDQAFFHGSTIDGDLSARSVTFEKHFQFSATVTGDTDFEETHFDAHSTFRNGEVHGVTTFDAASFAGNADFTDTRFKGAVTFDRTEFYAQPRFDGVRFAVRPNLDDAVFPHTEAMNLSSGRRIIVARPEKLENVGWTIPFDAVHDSPTIPPAVAGLVDLDAALAAHLAHELKNIEAPNWYQLSRDALELTRTAVAQLDPGREENTTLVFGFSVSSPNGPEGPILDRICLAGVYTTSPERDRIQFSHLTNELEAVDHLVAVPATDDAFESGPSVGTHGEYRNAMLRRQGFQASLLQQDVSQSRLIEDFLPVLVASGQETD